MILNCHAKNEFKRPNLSGKIASKRIKQSDWPRKFCSSRVFCYDGNGKKTLSQESKHEQISPNQSPPSNSYVLSMKVLNFPCYLKQEIEV